MKGFLKTGIFFSLGLFASQANSQEIQWRAIPPATPASTTLAQAEPIGVRLDRPIPQDGGVPEFRPSLMKPTPVVRAQAPDEKKGFLSGGLRSLLPTSVAQAKPTPPRPLVPNVNELKPMPKSPEFVAPAPKALEAGPTMVAPSFPSDQSRVWGSTSSMPVMDGSPFLGIDNCGPGCNSCGVNTGCNTCGGCANTRAWIGAEYLMWWTKAQSVPALLTSSTQNGLNAGALGQPGTTVLLDSIDDTNRHGGRFYGGFYFPNHSNWGMDASYFFLGSETDSRSFFSAGVPTLSRPIIIPAGLAGAGESALFVANAQAGFVNGRFTANSFSDVHGLDVNLRRKIWAGSNFCLDLLGGYRYMALEEGLDLIDNETRGGQNIIARDQFRTKNYFHGGQFGLAGHWQFAQRWSLGGSFKFAFGNVEQTVSVRGNTTFVATGNVGNGGVLAVVSNIGDRRTDSFAFLPEIGVKLGYDVTDHCRVHLGYDFLLLTDVARPGEQIDRTVNPNLIPVDVLRLNPAATPPLRPAPLLRSTDFWATGINFGMTYHW